jgi:serine/threonine-protein kinase
MRSVVYMAPERLDETSEVDHRADLYSLAAVLYECLSGKPPHAALEESVLVQQILSEKPVKLELERPGLPAGLSEVVQRALSANPERRFATAAELARALEPFSRAKGVVAAEAPASTKARAAKSFSLPSVLGGVAALGLLSYYYLSKEPEAAPVPSARSVASAASARAPRASAAAPVPLAPSVAPSPSVPVSAPRASASASSAPSASAAPAASMLCYLNRISGVVATRGPNCRKPVFIKPNMTAREKFPKWIPAYCSELSVYHCEKTEPAGEPAGG